MKGSRLVGRSGYHGPPSDATLPLTAALDRSILGEAPLGGTPKGPSLQVLELIIFAGLAAIVLYQLYAVLGRRVGRQPEDTPAVPTTAQPVRAPDATDAVTPPADEGVALTGVAAVKAK